MARLQGRFFYAALFMVCWAVLALLYWPGNDGHFLFDFNMWATHYSQLGAAGLLNGFTDKSMHYAGHILPYLFFSVVGLNKIAWTIFLTGLHSLNALLLFICTEKIGQRLGAAYSKQAALLAVVFFISSPLHTEVVVWASAVWYLQVTALVLVCVLLMIRYAEGDARSFVWYYVLLAIAFFTWELAFCIPFIVMVLWFFGVFNGPRKNRIFFTNILPSFGAIALYMLINKLRCGAWVSHYGEEHHLRFKPALLVQVLFTYISKLTMLNVGLSYGLRDKILQHLQREEIACMIAAIFVVTLAAVSITIKKWKGLKLSWVFFLLSMAALAPVINLYPVYMKNIEQDRYLYLASAFFYGAAAWGILALPSRVLKTGVVAACTAAMIFYQHRFVEDWALAGSLQQGLLSSFRWQNAPRITILADADNVNGAYCLRSQPYSSFAEALQVHRHIDITNKVLEVYQYNVTQVADSMKAERIDSVTIKTSFTQWGQWFWKLGAGAPKQLETADFKAQTDDWNHSFTTVMKNRVPGEVFIYQVKDHWKEVY